MSVFTKTPMKVTNNYEEIVWSVANFTNSAYRGTCTYPEIQSKLFKVSSLDFFLRLYPFGSKEDLVGDVSLILFFDCAEFFSRNTKNEVKVRSKIAVIDSQGKRCLIQDRIKVFKQNFSKGKRNRRDDRYVLGRREDLIDSTNDFLSGDSLKIYCEFEVVDEDLNPPKSTLASAQPDLVPRIAEFKTIPKPELGLSNGFSIKNGLAPAAEKFQDSVPKQNSQNSENSQNWESGSLSDGELTVGGKLFKVHKAILAAQSVELKALFKLGVNEIPDLEAKVFEEILKFIYTGHVDLEEGGVVAELFSAADEFGLPELKSKCEDFLCSKLRALGNIHSNKIENFNQNISKVMDETSLKAIENKPELYISLLSKSAKF